jgi:hypothetical protein
MILASKEHVERCDLSAGIRGVRGALACRDAGSAARREKELQEEFRNAKSIYVLGRGSVGAIGVFVCHLRADVWHERILARSVETG